MYECNVIYLCRRGGSTAKVMEDIPEKNFLWRYAVPLKIKYPVQKGLKNSTAVDSNPAPSAEHTSSPARSDRDSFGSQCGVLVEKKSKGKRRRVENSDASTESQSPTKSEDSLEAEGVVAASEKQEGNNSGSVKAVIENVKHNVKYKAKKPKTSFSPDEKSSVIQQNMDFDQNEPCLNCLDSSDAGMNDMTIGMKISQKSKTKSPQDSHKSDETNQRIVSDIDVVVGKATDISVIFSSELSVEKSVNYNSTDVEELEISKTDEDLDDSYESLKHCIMEPKDNQSTVNELKVTKPKKMKKAISNIPADEVASLALKEIKLMMASKLPKCTETDQNTGGDAENISAVIDTEKMERIEDTLTKLDVLPPENLEYTPYEKELFNKTVQVLKLSGLKYVSELVSAVSEWNSGVKTEEAAQNYVLRFVDVIFNIITAEIRNMAGEDKVIRRLLLKKVVHGRKARFIHKFFLGYTGVSKERKRKNSSLGGDGSVGEDFEVQCASNLLDTESEGDLSISEEQKSASALLESNAITEEAE